MKIRIRVLCITEWLQNGSISVQKNYQSWAWGIFRKQPLKPEDTTFGRRGVISSVRVQRYERMEAGLGGVSLAPEWQE